jgi:hypothetical protein
MTEPAGRYLPPGWTGLTVATDRMAAAAAPGRQWSGGIEAVAWLANPHGSPGESVHDWLAAWRLVRDALCRGDVPALSAVSAEPIAPLAFAAAAFDNPWRVPDGGTASPADGILLGEDALRMTIAAYASPAAPTGRTLTGSSPRAQCRDLIHALAAAGEAPGSKDALFDMACGRIEGLSRRAFDTAWGEAAPESWRRPGRR